jgi:hypothetical protein
MRQDKTANHTAIVVGAHRAMTAMTAQNEWHPRPAQYQLQPCHNPLHK